MRRFPGIRPPTYFSTDPIERRRFVDDGVREHRSVGTTVVISPAPWIAGLTSVDRDTVAKQMDVAAVRGSAASAAAAKEVLDLAPLEASLTTAEESSM